MGVAHHTPNPFASIEPRMRWFHAIDDLLQGFVEIGLLRSTSGL
jgi:hypothetical protein